VSALGLGCWGMSQAYGPSDGAESVATLERALDLGVTLLDTSMSYGRGHNERLLARLLASRQDLCARVTRSRLEGERLDRRSAVRVRPLAVQRRCELPSATLARTFAP
jgi:aryl-alcohol dehydrogenase-like predicted oxidoreductase